MGDRGQVYIEDVKVYLYTHWGATDLIKDAQNAISKRWRWDDPEYLARIVFDSMTRNDHDNETGYGICNDKHDDIWRLITINCKENAITVSDYDNEVFRGTFEEFINYQET